jgi:hypothetical protein
VGGLNLLNWNINFKTGDDKMFTFGSSNDYSIGYSSTEDSWRLVTGGNLNTNEVIVVNSSGNVGIGTTSPTALLDIAGDASASGSLVFRGTSPVTLDVLNDARLDIQTSVGGDAGLSPVMTVLGNGNVGIGTTTPGAPLHVVSDSSNKTIRLEENTGGEYIELGVSSAGNFYIYEPGGNTLFGIMENEGTVGIANAANNPSALLDVAWASDEYVQIGGSAQYIGNTLKVYRNVNSALSDSPLVDFTNDATTDDQPLLRLQQDASGDIFQAFDATTEVFVIKDGGNVGIGTTAPTALLDVAGDASASGSLVFRGTSPVTLDVLNDARLDIQTSVGGDAGLSPVMSVLGNGNIGIGTTAPSDLMDIWGDGRFTRQGSATQYLELSPYNATYTGPRIRAVSPQNNAKSLKITTSYTASSGGSDNSIFFGSGLLDSEATYLTIEGSLSTNPGYVGVGDSTPASLLTVGSGDLFQVDSNGEIVSIGGVAHSIVDTAGDLVITGNGDLAFDDDTLSSEVDLSVGDTGLNTSLTQGIVDAINDVYDIASGQGGSAGYWQLNNKVIAPYNTTLDLAVGGTATSSAKFSVEGLTGNTRVWGDVTIDGDDTGAEILTIGDATVRSNDANDATITLYGEQSGTVNSASITNTGTNLSFSSSNVNFLFNPSSLVQIGTGNGLRLYDSGNTDYVNFSHDSTDFNIAGTNTADINITGANLALQADNEYLKIGTGDDLQLYHNGTDSFILNATNDLYIGADSGSAGSQIQFGDEGGSNVYGYFITGTTNTGDFVVDTNTLYVDASTDSL